eukprot:6186348-Pleurochrysis_carterae.AAC.1
MLGTSKVGLGTCLDKACENAISRQLREHAHAAWRSVPSVAVCSFQHEFIAEQNSTRAARCHDSAEHAPFSCAGATTCNARRVSKNRCARFLEQGQSACAHRGREAHTIVCAHILSCVPRKQVSWQNRSQCRGGKSETTSICALSDRLKHEIVGEIVSLDGVDESASTAGSVKLKMNIVYRLSRQPSTTSPSRSSRLRRRPSVRR